MSIKKIGGIRAGSAAAKGGESRVVDIDTFFLR